MSGRTGPAGVISRSFATRARTIDHLGREQIADCPTAVSELWKNSWDAYARNVMLRIFAEEHPVAGLTDDGHGMRQQDLFNRWLVIGTESKVSDETPTTVVDRNGLAVRVRQGQKGIGRLSSAKLGSILLMISKHHSEDYVAALIDWRMFENPYLNLSDVTVATGTFKSTALIFEALPSFADSIVDSVLMQSNGWRSEERQPREAWKLYDEDLKRAVNSGIAVSYSRRIVQGMKSLPFRPDHLGGWNGPGTAMLIYELDDTLRALPTSGDTNPVREEIEERFERTLSNFVDPYSVGLKRPEFSYRAEVLADVDGAGRSKIIVGAEKAIDRTQIQEMEHQLEGTVGEDGIFRGRIKAFGTWVEGKVEFELPPGLLMPDRAQSLIGPFEIYIASMEFEVNSSTHPPSEHSRYIELAKDYSGLMIYRDGLRVLPYGREDNDFFEIEYRRSKNAGRYFWNHRQMFGRIALTRAGNPNMKDKAGREGFIDNTAAKTFRQIVSNILYQSARRYFGSASDIRKPHLDEIKAKNKAAKAEAESKKLRERERKQFQLELERAESILPALDIEIAAETDTLTLERDIDVAEAAGRLSEWRGLLADAAMRSQPSGTARLAPRYQAAVAQAAHISGAITLYERKFRETVDRYSAAQPELILAAQIKESTRAVRQQIEGYQNEIASLQREQYKVVRELADKRISDFKREAEAIAARTSTDKTEFSKLVEMLVQLREEWTDDNRNIFGVYLSALEAVKDQIDLETLASVQVQDLREAAVELDRLTALAQLGIAVEIAAHDLADFDEMATAGLNALPEELRNSRAVQDIRLGLEGLTDQLRFLSPLRLSGDKVQRWIDGAEIATFVEKFFAPTLARAGISFVSTIQFQALRLYERPARVFPVFLNLVNNSIYWVSTVPRVERRILLDVIGKEVLVADSGPGVAEDDLGQIFKLFFTRKHRSGRGVGLYLARSNLAAGGHTIRYRTNEDRLPLSGAAFLIGFRDAEFEEQSE